LSFFDEADEPRRTPPSEAQRPRRAARPPRGPSGRPPGGSGRRPGGQHQQDVQTRRLVAVGVIVIVIIAMALLIHGCQVSQTNSSLKSYAANVNTLITRSDNNGAQMFSDLVSGKLNSNGIETLQNELNTAAGNAQTHLSQAKSLSAPGQMASAQSSLVQAMQMRADGISKIAANIQNASNQNTSKDGVYDISVGTSLLYASDVIYKTFVTPNIAKALNGANIPIGGTTGAQINAGQIVTDIGWLQSTFIAVKIGATLPTKAANADNNGPGLHGHELNSVSVSGTALSTVSTNTVAANPAPTFTLSLTNGGDFNEYDVECEVSVAGLSDRGTSTIAETMTGQTTSCTVQLPSPPTPGTYQVTAEVVPVPKESNTKNNYLTFPITFN
jgi:hypothetical protein